MQEDELLDVEETNSVKTHPEIEFESPHSKRVLRLKDTNKEDSLEFVEPIYLQQSDCNFGEKRKSIRLAIKKIQKERHCREEILKNTISEQPRVVLQKLKKANSVVSQKNNSVVSQKTNSIVSQKTSYLSPKPPKLSELNDTSSDSGKKCSCNCW